MPTKLRKRPARKRKSFRPATPAPPPPKAALPSRTPCGHPAAADELDLRPRCHDLFSELDAPAQASFGTLASLSAYPKGATLFMEGQESRGVYIVLHGQVKLSLSSREGKTLIWKLSAPGSLLGLAATVLRKPYEVTAVTIEPCQFAFVRSDSFLRFLAGHPQGWLDVLRHLSEDHDLASKKLRVLGGMSLVSEKLAWLLAEMFGLGAESSSAITLQNLLTHQEIAEVIGTSRETVTRALGTLRTRGLAARSAS